MKRTRTFMVLLLILALVLFSGCSKKDDLPNPSADHDITDDTMTEPGIDNNITDDTVTGDGINNGL